MRLEDYAALRPNLFHLTARSNVDVLKKERRLYPAVQVLKAAGASVEDKRRVHVEHTFGKHRIHIRDQAPLHSGNVQLEKSWSFERLVRELNSRVFFWPGSERPIAYGMRHFERYEKEQPLILRVRVDSLLERNPNAVPEVCKYNSGSPRCTNGNKSPRGPNTFVPLVKSDLRPSQVVEFTFASVVELPDDVEVANNPAGPWKTL